MLVTNHGKSKELFLIDGQRVFVVVGDNLIDDKVFKKLEKEEQFKGRMKTEKNLGGIFSTGGSSKADNKNAEKAGKIIEDAEEDALEIMQKAEDKAAKLEADAQAKLDKATEDAAKIVADAEVKATDIKAKAQAKADKIAPKEA